MRAEQASSTVRTDTAFINSVQLLQRNFTTLCIDPATKINLCSQGLQKFLQPLRTIPFKNCRFDRSGFYMKFGAERLNGMWEGGRRSQRDLAKSLKMRLGLSDRNPGLSAAGRLLFPFL